MRRALVLTAGFALAAWIGFTSWGPGGRSIAAADLRQALVPVKIVHITGMNQAVGNAGTIPLAFKVDKWLRREPYAMFESNTPSKDASVGPEQTFIVAGDDDHTYWYFPNRENKAILMGPTKQAFLDNILAVVQPAASQDAPWRVTGHTTLDGREVDLLTSPDGQEELAVDSKSLLTYRARQFETQPDGSRLMTTDMKFAYDQSPPEHVFDWRPPAGAKLVDKRRPQP